MWRATAKRGYIQRCNVGQLAAVRRVVCVCEVGRVAEAAAR